MHCEVRACHHYASTPANDSSPTAPICRPRRGVRIRWCHSPVVCAMAGSPMMGSPISCHSMPTHTQYMAPFSMLLGRRLITRHRMQCSLHHSGRVGPSAATSLTQFPSTPTNAASRAHSRSRLLHHRHLHKLVGIRGSFVQQLSTCDSAKCTRATRDTSRMVVELLRHKARGMTVSSGRKRRLQ